MIGDLPSLPGPDQASPPDFQGVTSQIASSYSGLSGLNYRQTVRVLKDALLLPVVGRLASSPIWPKDQDALVKALRPYLRIGIYQAVLPLNYVISIWVGNPSRRSSKMRAKEEERQARRATPHCGLESPRV